MSIPIISRSDPTKFALWILVDAVIVRTIEEVAANIAMTVLKFHDMEPEQFSDIYIKPKSIRSFHK